jgi:uncharacterized metal-binding protein YceD (DUF177 family)
METQIAEFSRPVSIADIPDKGVRRRLEATDDERQALASRLGVVSVARLDALIEAKPWRRDGFRVTGTFEIEVEQTCIVSQESMTSVIAEEIDLHLQRDDEKANEHTELKAGNLIVDPLDEDEPEVLHGQLIDLGEIVAEHAVLAIDPYPRIDDVESTPIVHYSDAEEATGPFAALAAIKARQNDD